MCCREAFDCRVARASFRIHSKILALVEIDDMGFKSTPGVFCAAGSSGLEVGRERSQEKDLRFLGSPIIQLLATFKSRDVLRMRSDSCDCKLRFSLNVLVEKIAAAICQTPAGPVRALWVLM
eukprot:scaffold7349_cov173-Amphora_coffeaeformis.AAC.122